MLRRSHILTTAALLAVCATPASAATYEELQSDGAAGGDVAPPPSSIVASAADEYQDLRSPDTVDAAEHRGYTRPTRAVCPEPGLRLARRGRRGRDLPSVPAGTHARPGPYTDSERKLVESPEVQEMVRRAVREIRETPTPSRSMSLRGLRLGATRASARPECSRCSASPPDRR